MAGSTPDDVPLDQRFVDAPTAGDRDLQQEPMTIAAAATALGVSASTLRRRVAKGGSAATGEAGGQRLIAHKTHTGSRTRWAVYLLGASGQARSEDAVRQLRSAIGDTAQPESVRRWWPFRRRSA
ncbi:MAG: hypothetical protein IH609_13270 [Dehalococcoidia bacterium]|nr:hypothetical protein [Dehalococcoidia bacterium]